jgi:hypothetical protein
MPKVSFWPPCSYSLVITDLHSCHHAAHVRQGRIVGKYANSFHFQRYIFIRLQLTSYSRYPQTGLFAIERGDFSLLAVMDHLFRIIPKLIKLSIIVEFSDLASGAILGVLRSGVGMRALYHIPQVRIFFISSISFPYSLTPYSGKPFVLVPTLLYPNYNTS